MADHAVAGNTGVIKTRRRNPRIGGMTSSATGRRWHVIDRLALRLHAVVATHTGSLHLTMIDRDHGGPRRDGMARLATRRGSNMCGALALSLYAVVACLTVSCNASMIKPRTCKRRCVMAIIARRLSHKMIGRFAYGDYIIVASRARSRDLRMIDIGDGNPGGRVMAGIAITTGWNMVRRFARCSHTIVTTATSTKHVGVINDGRNPRRRHVTTVAVVTSWYVARGLARCLGTVVTTHAGAHNRAVVEQTRC